MPAVRLYLQLFGSPHFCFKTPGGDTPLVPLPRGLWAMLPAYLATCDDQAAPQEAVLAMWNARVNKRTGKTVPAYGLENPIVSVESAKSSLATNLAKARKDLVTHCQKALRKQGEAAAMNTDVVDRYTFLPNQEQVLYLNPETVESDVARFQRLYKEARLLRSSLAGKDQLQQILVEAKKLYAGEFLQNGDAYFGRADTFYSDEAETPARPWIADARLKLAAQFDEIKDLLQESSRTAFKSLPDSLDLFVPRSEFHERIRAWLLRKGEYGGQPLLLLAGPGGAGKTRLAIETIRSLGEAAVPLYGDRIYFLSFAGSPDKNTVPAIARAVAECVKAPKSVLNAEPEEISERLRVWLADNPQRLLVLDNFETVTRNSLEAGAWLVNLLRGTNGQVRCLVTTQHHFTARIPCYPVEGMQLSPSPDDPGFANSECCTLYKKRASEMARYSSRSYRLLSRMHKPLWEMFTTAGRLPLGVELIASRCADMSVEQIEAAANGLREEKKRLDFLQNKHTDLLRVHEHHTGMRSCISWTWKLLPPLEQDLFAGLGIFPRDSTTDAAQAVCNVTDERFQEWRNLSLLRWDEKQKRWSFHPLVREFAYEKFDALSDAEAENMYDEFCRHYLGIAERSDPQLKTIQFEEAVTAFDKEEVNLVAAQQYCRRLPADGSQYLLRLASALSSYRSLRGRRFLIIRELEEAIEYSRSQASNKFYREALCHLIANYFGISGGRDNLADIGAKLKSLCSQNGSYGGEELRALAMVSNDLEEKLRLFEAAIKAFEQDGNRARKINTTTHLVIALNNAEQYQEGVKLLTSLLPEAIEAGYYDAALIASNLALIAAHLGNEPLAEITYRQGLELCRKYNTELVASWIFFNFALQKERKGQIEQAAMLLKYGEKIRNSVSEGAEEFSAQEIEFTDRVKKLLGKEIFQEADTLTSDYSLNVAIKYALSLPLNFSDT